MNRPAQTESGWQRTLAALGIGLVLALGVFGADAGLHAKLHGADHADHSHDAEQGGHCAVELFAGGVSLPLDLGGLVAVPVVRTLESDRPPHEVWIAETPHRQPPGRGPPLV